MSNLKALKVSIAGNVTTKNKSHLYRMIHKNGSASYCTLTSQAINVINETMIN